MHISKYEEHNYIKEKIIYQKIEYNQIIEEEMNNLIYQNQYFKYICLNYPKISYNDILLNLSEKYNIKKCYFTLKQFNNFKNNYNRIIINKQFNYNYLNEIKLNNKKLLNFFMVFEDKNENNHYIKIFGTLNSMKNYTNNNITQYFIDSTYKFIPKIYLNIKDFYLFYDMIVQYIVF